ncbi:hypothetical protein F0U44_06460 [Nocardioides humilatus]|uniref:Acyl-CoA dehydrogenase n=1 Tax=Nocardioides humilatus TaxID=2607660 RepID=A0A5B1LN08_9ACTN|nr:acyl-CoA dehydrogenase family protein [Nocardioides humilatus]KAA1421904.1 hypothetical protein F0U44_06460 [Nocardioides humilatus]
MELVRRTGYDEDHATFRDSVRRFVAAEVTPDLDRWRAAGRFDRGLFANAGEQGFLGTSVPEELGGAGVDDPRFPVVLVEELARSGAAGLALVVARQLGVVLPMLAALAEWSDDVAAALTALAAGESVGCVVVLSSGSTSARAVPGAAVADLFVVVDADGAVVVLPRESVGVDVTCSLLGGSDAAVADVTVAPHLLDTTSPVEPAGLAARSLDLWSAVVGLAAAQAAFELTGDYVQERAVFGKPLSSFENTRFRLAENGAELVAAHQLLDSAVAALADGDLADALAAATRIVVERVHDQVVDQGMQLHGGYGYMREYPISHAFGDARFVRATAAAVSEPRRVLADALGL